QSPQNPPEPPAPCNGMGPGVTVRVACTGYCADSQVNALKLAADQMKIKLQFIVLMDGDGRSKFDLSDPNKYFDAIISPGGWDTLPGYFAALGPDNDEKKGLRAHMEDLFCTQKLGKTGPFTQKRDSFEFNFDVDTYLKNYRYKDIPYLAACYGMQLMGAALGMPEYVDIAADLKIPNRKHVSDPITITDRSSQLAKLFPQGSFTGYEDHHQGLHMSYYTRHKAEFPGLKVVAVSNNGLIMEGMELNNRTFLGTQFHPEDSADDVKLPIYKWLLGSACRHIKQSGKRFSLANFLARFQRPPAAPPGASENSIEQASMGCPAPAAVASPPAPTAPAAAPAVPNSTITGP
ncbi:MAG: glutamine amidotransferase-related protein, partial [Bdellovibrionota bacterium]